MTTITHQVTVEIVFCAWCSGPIALERNRQLELRRTHKSFYCPVGHRQNYPGETEAERLLTALNLAQGEVNSERTRRQNLEGTLKQTQDALTRATTRTQNGVCLHCRRHFVNLERHMSTKHGKGNGLAVKP